MSTVIVKRIYIEDLFQWFYDHVNASCGDGFGVIVCQNYEETADTFVKWFKEKYNKDKFWHERDFDAANNRVSFHDSNECFAFTNIGYEFPFDGDYVFVVEEDCYWATDLITDKCERFKVEAI